MPLLVKIHPVGAYNNASDIESDDELRKIWTDFQTHNIVNISLLLPYFTYTKRVDTILPPWHRYHSSIQPCKWWWWWWWCMGSRRWCTRFLPLYRQPKVPSTISSYNSVGTRQKRLFFSFRMMCRAHISRNSSKIPIMYNIFVEHFTRIIHGVTAINQVDSPHYFYQIKFARFVQRRWKEPHLHDEILIFVIKSMYEARKKSVFVNRKVIMEMKMIFLPIPFSILSAFN